MCAYMSTQRTALPLSRLAITSASISLPPPPRGAPPPPPPQVLRDAPPQMAMPVVQARPVTNHSSGVLRVKHGATNLIPEYYISISSLGVG
jgi:hypothetical protein